MRKETHGEAEHQSGFIVFQGWRVNWRVEVSMEKLEFISGAVFKTQITKNYPKCSFKDSKKNYCSLNTNFIENTFCTKTCL
jgi:hypothetical protein